MSRISHFSNNFAVYSTVTAEDPSLRTLQFFLLQSVSSLIGISYATGLISIQTKKQTEVSYLEQMVLLEINACISSTVGVLAAPAVTVCM